MKRVFQLCERLITQNFYNTNKDVEEDEQQPDMLIEVKSSWHREKAYDDIQATNLDYQTEISQETKIKFSQLLLLLKYLIKQKKSLRDEN